MKFKFEKFATKQEAINRLIALGYKPHAKRIDMFIAKDGLYKSIRLLTSGEYIIL